MEVSKYLLAKTNIENILFRKLIIISVVLKFFDCHNIFGKYEVIRLYSSFSGSDSDYEINDDEFVSSSQELFSIQSWLTIQTFRHKETSKSDRIIAIPLANIAIECRHLDLFLSRFRKTEHTQPERHI